MKSFILGSVLVLAAVCLSLAQQLNNAPADTNSVTANPIPSSQAPDDVIKKLSDLTHAGKYPEAQQLTAGLLLAYPDDQRLIKAKTILDKLLATASPTDVAPNDSQPTNSVAQPAASGASDELTGMDKVEYDSLIEMAKEAQQTTAADEQTKLLQQFMDKSDPFLQKHPDQMLLWQFRAVAALGLGDPLDGFEAGQKLVASGLADKDQNVENVLAKLNIKDWLDANRVVVTANDWKITVSDWHQTLSYYQSGVIKDPTAVNLSPPMKWAQLLMDFIVGVHLTEQRSNSADWESATNDIDALIAKNKTVGDPKALDKYRSDMIQLFRHFGTKKRLNLRANDVEKLWEKSGAQIVDPDLQVQLPPPSPAEPQAKPSNY
jgi:hypothetical protein